MNLFLLLGILGSAAASCGRNGISCLTSSQYQICVDGEPWGSMISCPSDTFCDENDPSKCIKPVPIQPQGLKCKSSNRQCLNAYEYKLCINAGDFGYLVGNVIQCPPNTECDDSARFPCVPATTTTSTTTTTTERPTTTITTTVAPVTPPNCSSVGKSSRFPAPNPNQYYQCYKLLFWWERKLVTCPWKRVFNPVTEECE